MVTLEDIRRAEDWLDTKTAVVSPGPIETIRDALDLAKLVVMARDNNQATTILPQQPNA